MIKNREEYVHSLQTLEAMRQALANQRIEYAGEGFSPDEVRRLSEAHKTLMHQVMDEVDAYRSEK
jgi:hypothetical protein